MKPNPCVLCGKQPRVETWGTNRYSAYCYREVKTHALNTYGATKDAAIDRWNRLNPARRQSIIRRVLNILGLGVSHGF